MPISDAKLVFTDNELAHMRKNIEETEVIVHEDILLQKRSLLGLATLPSEDTGQIEWTYPVYEYGSEGLNMLLCGSSWNSETNAI